MSNSKPNRLPFPAQLLTTGIIVVALVGTAQLGNSEEDSRAFDEAAEHTRFQLEGATRGVDRVDRADNVLAGRWEVEYEDPEFTGTVIYELREEEEGLRGYVVEISDEQGEWEPDSTFVFSVTSFDGSKGKGSYQIEYEGKHYDVPCDIQLLPSDDLRVQYDYYGYTGDETWVRVEREEP